MKSSIRSRWAPSQGAQFGFLFSVIFLLLAWYFETQSHRGLAIAAALTGVALALTSILNSELLSLPANLWLRLGLLLSRILNPVLTGLVFVLSILPVTLTLKIIRKELLETKFNPDDQTYWISRLEQPGPFTEQFQQSSHDENYTRTAAVCASPKKVLAVTAFIFYVHNWWSNCGNRGNCHSSAYLFAVLR